MRKKEMSFSKVAVATKKPLATALLLTLVFSSLFVLMFVSIISAVPQGVSSIAVDANETRANTAGTILNTSGGYITTVNLTGVTQNPRWKAFVGQVTGTFTLDDSSGSTIFDWSITTTGGEVYATTQSGTINWTGIQCANLTLLMNEDSVMSHTSPDDNISATFNTSSGATHTEFFVGTTNITENTCPTLNTYVANNSQDTDFEEIALTDSPNRTTGNVVYATIIETDEAGFDSESYDFQMIVPEVGSNGFTGSTAYYLYVELS